jgi:hypothetical protein
MKERWSVCGLQEGRSDGALSEAEEKVIQRIQSLPLGRPVAEAVVEHWPDSDSESSEKRYRVPEWPHSAARSVLSQLEDRLFGTEQTRGNLRVSGLFVRLGLIGTAYRYNPARSIILLANHLRQIEAEQAGELLLA